MLGGIKNLSVLFRSPLCRRVTFAVFLSIIVIEAVILVPSYWNQEARLIADLEERARLAVASIYNDNNARIDRQFAASIAQRVLSGKDIKGAVIVSPEGLRLAEAGEYIGTVLTDVTEDRSARNESKNGPRHEAYWRAGTLFSTIGVAVSLDSAAVLSELQDFLIRIAGLVALIATFVTATTMLVLGRGLIFPMLQLRERLVVKQDDGRELDVPAANQTDEFGDIIRKFNAMLLELYANKRELEQRVAERTADLSKSEERLRAVIDNSPSYIYLKDLESRILLINKAYEQHYGVTQDVALGSQGQEWLGPENAERLKSQDQKVIAGGKPVETEIESSNKSGRRSFTHSVKFPVRNETGQIVGIGGIASDVTERKKIEQDLRESQLKADAANRTKSLFLANMSHELRTPMNGVLGMANVLSTSDLTTDQRESVETIKESGEALLDLLNDILDLSKIEAAHVEMESLDFSIGDLLTSANSLWAHLAQDKGLAFSVENNMTDNDLVRTDRGRLRQVINNLVGNAIKFTSKGRIEIGLDAESRDDGRIGLRFEVRDTGIGLSAEQIEKLFKPFAQADSSTTREYGGTGLGLTISKNIVELLGGDIGVESTPGEGSTFWFTAIVERGDPAKARVQFADESLSLADTTDGRALRILVAEDNHINQKVITWLLVPLNCQLDIVENGLEAVAAITRSNYDLVLMDVQMPEMDGITATKKIRSLPDPVASIPIIAMTANAMQGDREAYLEAGMNEYVAKPIDQRELLNAITRCANVSMPDIDEAAFTASLNKKVGDQPLNEKAAEELDDLMGGLDKLLDASGH